MIHKEHKDQVKESIEKRYPEKYNGEKVEVIIIVPSDGATLITK